LAAYNSNKTIAGFANSFILCRFISHLAH